MPAQVEIQNLPPLVEADHFIMVCVDLGEELIELGIRDHQSCTYESCFEFVLVQLTILITVNTLEKLPEFLLGLLDKCPKFSIGPLALVRRERSI